MRLREGATTLEHRAVAGAQCRQRVVGADVALAERRPRALERAVYRLNGRVEQLRNLRSLPSKDFAEDEHRTLTRWQLLQRRDEREADRFTLDNLVGGVCLRRDQLVRDRLDPSLVSRNVEVGLERLECRPQFHGPKAPPCALEHVEADVGRNAVQPGTHRRAPLEAVAASPGAYEGLLHRVLGIEWRPEHPVAMSRQLCPVPLHLPEFRRGRNSGLLHENDSRRGL